MIFKDGELEFDATQDLAQTDEDPAFITSDERHVSPI